MMVVRCKKAIEADCIPGPGSGMSSARFFEWVVGRLAFWIESGSQMIWGSQRHLVGNKCNQNNSADELSHFTEHLINKQMYESIFNSFHFCQSFFLCPFKPYSFYSSRFLSSFCRFLKLSGRQCNDVFVDLFVQTFVLLSLVLTLFFFIWFYP